MLQFRGRGLVAIRVDGEPGAVKVTPERPLCVSTPHLLGWIGHVVALGGGGAGRRRAGEPPRPLQISCEGEGVVSGRREGEGSSMTQEPTSRATNRSCKIRTPPNEDRGCGAS